MSDNTLKECFRREWFSTTNDPAAVTELALDPTFVASRPPVVSPAPTVPESELVRRAHPETVAHLVPVLTDPAVVNRLARSAARVDARRAALAHPLTTDATRVVIAERAMRQGDSITVQVLANHLSPAVAAALAEHSPTPLGVGAVNGNDALSQKWSLVLSLLEDPTPLVRRALEEAGKLQRGSWTVAPIRLALGDRRLRPQLARIVEEAAPSLSPRDLHVAVVKMAEAALDVDAAFARLLVADPDLEIRSVRSGRVDVAAWAILQECPELSEHLRRLTGDAPPDDALAGLLACYAAALAAADRPRLAELDAQARALLACGQEVDAVSLSRVVRRVWRPTAEPLVRDLDAWTADRPDVRAAVVRSLAVWWLADMASHDRFQQWVAHSGATSADVVEVIRAANDLVVGRDSVDRHHFVRRLWSPGDRSSSETYLDRPEIDDTVFDAILDTVGPADQIYGYANPSGRVVGRLVQRLDALVAQDPTARTRFLALMGSWSTSWSSLLDTVAAMR